MYCSRQRSTRLRLRSNGGNELTSEGEMAEPTYEELKARLAELEKQGAGSVVPGIWNSKSAKGGSERIWAWPVSRHSLLRAVDSPSGRQ